MSEGSPVVFVTIKIDANASIKMTYIINKIFEQKPWGYSVPYYLAARSFCHPNYASFLIEKNIPFDIIDKILKQIPENSKTCFDKKLIEKLFNETVQGALTC